VPFGRGGLCAAIILVAASSARADDRALVLVTGRAGAAFANRLRAEAAQVGIVMVGDGDASLDEEPAIVCRRNGAIGLIRVWSDTKVALFLPATDRLSAPVETFQVSPEERDSLALRIIEEIWSRLAAAPQAPAQKAAPPAPQEAPEAAAPAKEASATIPDATRSRPPLPADGHGPELPSVLAVPLADAPAAAGTPSGAAGLTLDLSGGVAGTFSPGGFGTTLQAAVAVVVRKPSGFGLALRGAFPLRTRELTAAEGAVRWRPALATIEVAAEPWRRRGWSVILGAEAGAMFINLSPSAAPDYRANPDRMAVAVFLLGAGVRAPLYDWLAARVSLSVGVAAPRPVVRIDGRDVAHWGRPCVFLAVTTELRLLEANHGASRP
jgi:hypothetical protein